jgi:ABC-2 type transport system ATP-binding protein
VTSPSPAIPAEPQPEPSAEVVLSLRNLTCRFGTLAAVDRVDLDVQRGEVLGLLGPNGCGKSTTLNLVLGYLRPSSGTITIAGHDLAKARRRALASVGGLVEGSAFYPYLSGRTNLEMVARLRGVSNTRVDELLTMLDMQHAAHRAFGGYSQGMRQRLGVAGALLHSPDLIVLDEPTSGLDPAGTRDMRALIPRIAGEGHTVILASHLLTEVEQVCRRVTIMKQGRLIATGTVAELLRREGRMVVTVEATAEGPATEVLRSLESVSDVARHKTPGSLLVTSPLAGDALNRALADREIWASRIEAHRDTLESIFLELTGEELVAEAPAPEAAS